MDPSSVAERRRTFGTRLHSETNDGERAALSGRKVNTLVLALFGVLCMTQATLNIVLRLYLNSVCENITAQRDDLQQQFWNLQTSHETLSKQRDELQQQLGNISFAESLSKQNWSLVNGSFYLSDPLKRSWNDSRQYCLDRGADLIIINSPEEQEFAMTFGKRSWIGLTDARQEGVWRWVDSSPLTTSFWFPDEPNNDKGDEDCVEVIHFKPKHTNWNDLPCDTVRNVICERLSKN